jgi:hypothetical protein
MKPLPPACAAWRFVERPQGLWRQSAPPGFIRPCEPALLDRPPAGFPSLAGRETGCPGPAP